MAEYINADVFRAYLTESMRAFDRAASEHWVKQDAATLACSVTMGILDAIGGCNLPFADDVEEVKRGHWILRHEGAGHYWECSLCHRTTLYVTPETHYCGFCGAKLDEEDNDG